jgi:hypothetical protein
MGDNYSQYMVCFHFSPGQKPEAGLNPTSCTCRNPCKGCNKEVPKENQGSRQCKESDDYYTESSASSEDTTSSEGSDDDDTDSRTSPEVENEAQVKMVTNIIHKHLNNETLYSLLPLDLNAGGKSLRGAQV